MIQVEFDDDNSYIATLQALKVYSAALDKRVKPAKPGDAMLLNGVRKALDQCRKACPEHLREILALEGYFAKEKYNE